MQRSCFDPCRYAALQGGIGGGIDHAVNHPLLELIHDRDHRLRALAEQLVDVAGDRIEVDFTARETFERGLEISHCPGLQRSTGQVVLTVESCAHVSRVCSARGAVDDEHGISFS